MHRSFALAGLVVLAAAAPCAAEDWLQFRGPDNRSIAAADEKLPTTWNIVTGENIAWKAPLPGRGLSAPIIIGEQVVVTACSGIRQDRLHILSFDLASGEKQWERQFWATGRTMCHEKMSVAANTPASDGQRIFALYSTNDLICVDLKGNLQWMRGLMIDYPNCSNSLGMASSPIMAGKTLIVQVENDSQSLALGIDPATGENRWKHDRPQVANWTSPVLMPGKTSAEDVVLLQSKEGVSAYDPQDGALKWNFAKECNTIPSSTASGDVVFVPADGLTALKITGDKAETLWKDSRLGPSTPSPVAYRDRVYTVARAGVLKCADVKNGELLWQIRLKGSFSGTPVAAGEYLYLFNEEGLGQVVDLRDTASNDDRVTAYNDLAETILCSPAVAGSAIFVRSDQHLWKIAPAAAKTK